MPEKQQKQSQFGSFKQLGRNLERDEDNARRDERLKKAADSKSEKSK